MSVINGFKCVTNGFISKSMNIQHQPHLHRTSIRTFQFRTFSSQGDIHFTFTFSMLYFWVFPACFAVSWTSGSSWICPPPAGPESDSPVHPEAPGLRRAAAPEVQRGVAEFGIPHLPSRLVAQPHGPGCVHHRG